MLKHQHILRKSRRLREVFPRGAKDFQVTTRRDTQNLKERLAPSKVVLMRNEEMGEKGSRPCGTGCVVCPLLETTRAKIFKSCATKMTYKIRQDVTCESKNVIYLVTCGRHNTQGVGYTTDFKNRVANYRNHHKKNVQSCGISQHFQERGHVFEEDFLIQPIVKIVRPPASKEELKRRLEEFELYWQENLVTYEPHGMNKITEVEKARKKMKTTT
jgi:hypothetical protein